MAFSSPMDAAGGAVIGRFCSAELKAATAKIRPRHVTNLTSQEGGGREGAGAFPRPPTCPCNMHPPVGANINEQHAWAFLCGQHRALALLTI